MLARLARNRASLCFSILASTLAPATTGATVQQAAPLGVAAEDWAGVCAAYRFEQQAVFETAGKLYAHNKRQGWNLGFDSRGFSVEPNASDWSWGLQLVSYGFEGSEQVVGDEACASFEGGRVAYQWDDAVEEWFVNDERGLEHGFTIRERPVACDSEDSGDLTFRLEVRGNLAPRVHADGRGIQFVEERGKTVLNYSGLTVFDADGRKLKASFEYEGSALKLSVSERGARYPLTIDPVAQEAYLKAPDPGFGDTFGQSVAISGHTIIVGAYLEDSNGSGVNAPQTNNAAQQAGAAYVFVRSGSTWIQQASFKASNVNPGDLFGWTVAIDGDTAVVGAPNEDGGATGINGIEANESALLAGAAYVFVRNGSTWSQQAYVKASNTGPGDLFGASVGVFGDTMIVGATGEASNATGVNGDESDDSVPGAGAAYVYVRSGTTWSQEAYLKSANSDADDVFGWSIGISNETVVIGARDEDSSARGVGGDPANNDSQESGAAYVFVRTSGSTWNQEAYLKSSNSDSGDSFGVSVAIGNDTIVVGACDEDGSGVGVGADPLNNDLLSAGAAYVFGRTGTTWTEREYLKAFNSDFSDLFGWSVAVSGSTIVVGAVLEDSNATSSTGDQSNNSFSSAGAAYSFVRSGFSWAPGEYLKASNSGTNDLFGFAVALSGATLVVGANAEASDAAGVDGDGTNDNTLFAGAAYVFNIGGEFTSFCTGDGGDQMGCTTCPCANNAFPGTLGGCLNSAGTSASLAASGSTSVSLPSMSTGDLRFSISGAPPNAFCILNSGDGLAPANMINPCFGAGSGSQAAAFDGLRCAIMNTRRHGGRSADLNGEVGATSSPWGGEGGPPVGLAVAGGGFSSGQSRFFQVVHRDDPLAGCMRGLNTSQAVAVLFTP